MSSPHLVPLTPPARTGGGGAVADAAPALVLDAAALARLAELDPTGAGGLVERVLKTFRGSAAKLTAQLETARAVGDRAAIRLVAHTLKSSSGYIGALELSRCCIELEAAASRADAADLAPRIDAMTRALDLALAAISRRLEAAG